MLDKFLPIILWHRIVPFWWRRFHSIYTQILCDNHKSIAFTIPHHTKIFIWAQIFIWLTRIRSSFHLFHMQPELCVPACLYFIYGDKNIPYQVMSYAFQLKPFKRLYTLLSSLHANMPGILKIPRHRLHT